MLIRLLPEQAASYWDDIKGAIEVSLPPVVGMQGDRMQNILTALLLEELITWISVDKEKVVDGIVVTSFVLDKNSGTKALLIYCLCGYGETSKTSWEEGVETLRKFAKSSGCHRVIGYTDVPSLIKWVEKVGGETRYRFISIGV